MTVGESSAISAENTKLLVESNEKIAYINNQILINALDVKCLEIYGLTSSEIEREYNKQIDQIITTLFEIQELRVKTKCLLKRNNNLTLIDKIICFFNANHFDYVKNCNAYYFQLLSDYETTLEGKIQKVYSFLPGYVYWRAKVARMNIPVYAKYRWARKKLFSGDNFSEFTLEVINGTKTLH